MVARCLSVVDRSAHDRVYLAKRSKDKAVFVQFEGIEQPGPGELVSLCRQTDRRTDGQQQQTDMHEQSLDPLCMRAG